MSDFAPNRFVQQVTQHLTAQRSLCDAIKHLGIDHPEIPIARFEAINDLLTAYIESNKEFVKYICENQQEFIDNTTALMQAAK